MTLCVWLSVYGLAHMRYEDQNRPPEDGLGITVEFHSFQVEVKARITASEESWGHMT